MDDKLLLALVILAISVPAPGNSQGAAIFRSLFSRQPDQRLSAIVSRQVTNSSVEQCANMCVRETGFQCKSFDFDNTHKACLLYSVSVDDQDVYLIANPGRDHYSTAYKTLFHRLTNHMLTNRHNRRVDEVAVEECARRCILETYFKCRGFDYHIAPRTCWLTELSPERAGGVNIQEGWNYYERSPEGPLEDFVNYGFGHMRQLDGHDVYQRFIMGVSLDSCAEMCLQEKSFHCVSFDYFFERDDTSTCYLSELISANVYGLMGSYDARTMHFERREKYLKYFYATPYSVVLGNNHKTYTRVTPNRCARMCLEEEAFVCRSFDYKIQDATCLLSSKTGNDVGGLFNQGLREVHHFEMKPLLDCGGNMTSDIGDFASPNWPRNYAHHEHCTWDIHVQKHKVIQFKFTHLDFGLRSHNPCDAREDRLVITEYGPRGQDTFCVLPNTKVFTTHSNHARVTFITNSEMDGQGFRLFYTAEWPCDVLLTAAPGEFASPLWPENYPPSTRCSWRITAPESMRVRVRFTAFDLEQHTLGHCNEHYDHVHILDGGTVSSPKIGFYCGRQAAFTVRSSGRDMFVQFKSDSSSDHPGFHAHFDFETKNGTIVDTVSTLGEEFIPLDTDAKQHYVGEPGVGDRLYSVFWDAADNDDRPDAVSQREKTEEEDTAPVGRLYKTTMWAVISTLLLLLVVAAILMYLMWQKHRGRHQREEVRERSAAEEIVPLHINPSLLATKQNNENSSRHGNEIDLTGGGACGKENAYTNLIYEDIGKNKIKNINLDDSKC